MSQNVVAFFDECGSTVLNTPEGESDLYVAVAVIVDEENVESLSSQLDQIALLRRNGAEFKHTKIGNKHELRERILNDIAKLDFRYIALVVNKRLLHDCKGLAFRASFYKFINRKLYLHLGRLLSGAHLKIIADQYGSKEFMESAQGYFSKYMGLLFPLVQIKYADDRSSRLVQLADIIAGTISYAYDRYAEREFSENWRSILKEKEVGISVFPAEYVWQKEVNFLAGKEKDFEANVITKAYRYIDSENGGDEFSLARKIVLEELLNHKLTGLSSGIYAARLIEILKEEYQIEVSEQSFVSGVIGKLRDSGFIIAGTNIGYRLATDEEDICAYLDHNSSIIEPMVNRLKTAREAVLAISGRDILEGRENLKAFVDAYRENTLSRVLDPDIEIWEKENRVEDAP